MKTFLSWVFFVFATLLLWGAVAYMRELLWETGADLINLMFFPTLFLTALAGYWVSVRFGWKAANFPLMLVAAFPFLIDIYYLPLSELWLAFYFICVGCSLRLLHKNDSLPSPILFVSCLTGLVISAAVAHDLSPSLLPHALWRQLFGDGELFFSLPFLILLTCLRGKFMKNDIFNEYKSAFALSTGAFLLLFSMEWSVFSVIEGVVYTIAHMAEMDIFIPFYDQFFPQLAILWVSLILWLQVFIFRDPGESSFKRLNNWGLLGIGALFLLLCAQFAWLAFLLYAHPELVLHLGQPSFKA